MQDRVFDCAINPNQTIGFGDGSFFMYNRETSFKHLLIGRQNITELIIMKKIVIGLAKQRLCIRFKQL
ncbi:Uncharacterised protein [Vibrio cholerae]|nr:Uncharacterised protein [Vibrio cholerae]